MRSAARAAGERCVVLVRRNVPARDREPRFHLREPRLEVTRRVTVEPMDARPVRERGFRRAERARPVDRRAAAHATSLQDVDRLVRGLSRRRLLIQVRIRLGFQHAEVAKTCAADLPRRSRQRGRRAPGSRLRRLRPRRCRRCTTSQSSSRSRVETRRVDRLPARREACAKRVGQDRRLVSHSRRSSDSRRTGIADARPRARVAIPGREDQLMQRVVSAALQRPGAVAPAIEERSDLSRASVLPGGRDAGEGTPRGRERQAARTAGRAPPAPMGEVPGSRGRHCRRFR